MQYFFLKTAWNKGFCLFFFLFPISVVQNDEKLTKRFQNLTFLPAGYKMNSYSFCTIFTKLSHQKPQKYKFFPNAVRHSRKFEPAAKTAETNNCRFLYFIGFFVVSLFRKGDRQQTDKTQNGWCKNAEAGWLICPGARSQWNNRAEQLQRGDCRLTK